ncbi:MAG TPA: RNA pseudouridine synthase [Rectinemataceae bacterium]|nr:RNA pseudouridine synthase [Rectinemataceae bacterium]
MIPILFENDEILIVDKPAGLPAQPGERVGSSVISVVESELRFSPFPIHRLDKETAGCMMLAKNASAASRWSSLLGERGIGKYYRAICAGSPRRDAGSYSDDLSIGGKYLGALTRYTCLARFVSVQDAAPAYSLLELELGSGRTHQIRRHMAMHAHPILGDDKYGDFALNRLLKKTMGVRHLLLWACRLEIPGYPPIRASLPPYFSDFLGLWPDAPAISDADAPAPRDTSAREAH